MLGSDHDGEVASAARMTLKFLKARNIAWADIIIAASARIDPVEIVNYAQTFKTPERAEIDKAKAMALFLQLHCLEEMPPEDRAFIKSMLTNKSPSVKQIHWLTVIYHRYVKWPTS
jgi:hypothetical protein